VKKIEGKNLDKIETRDKEHQDLVYDRVCEKNWYGWQRKKHIK